MPNDASDRGTTAEWLERFFQAADWVEICDAARELSRRDDPEVVPRLLPVLHDPSEARRWGAVYALGFSRRDGRVVNPLIQVLRDRQETVRVRSQAAECLGYLGRKKAIRPLIESSADASAEVRFWCVFALGQYWWRRNKPPQAVIRAMEARLDDRDRAAGYWPVWLEALAMFRGWRTRHPARQTFRETILRVFEDPLAHADHWPWATWYVEICDLRRQAATVALVDAAIRKVHEAGFDPVSFGRPAQPE